MDRIKIIFLLPDLGAGGAERVVSILSKELIKKGCDVDIVSMFGNRVSYELPEDVSLLNFSTFNTDKMRRVRHLREYLKRQKKEYDKVVAIAFQESCLKTLVAAKLGLRIKSVATERNNPFRKGNTLFRRLKNSLPFIFSDYSVFQTPDARKYYLLLRNGKTSIIPNPITKSEYVWNGVISPSGIVSVCRLHKQKNLPLSFEVIKSLQSRYPDIHLDIYGEGELEEELQKRISEMGLEDAVSLRGLTREVQKTLCNYSIFLSTSDYEGISNSMLEAMSVGMPVVCTDCPIGGARMMLSEGRGELCEVGNAESIVSAIEKLLNDSAYCRTMAKNAYEKSLRYSEERIAQEWYELLIK